MPELAQAADGLHPPKDLFDELSFPLADVIARMSRGPAIDRTPPTDRPRYREMHALRKGQARWMAKGDVVGQTRLIHKVFGLAV